MGSRGLTHGKRPSARRVWKGIQVQTSASGFEGGNSPGTEEGLVLRTGGLGINAQRKL